MTFDKRIEQLSADQLLGLIKRFDCEKSYPYVGATDFERVAFYIGIGGEKELAHVVEKWAEENLNMEFEKGFVYMYREPGVYALTTVQDGAYEGKRLVLPAIEVIEWLLHAGGTLEEEIEEYLGSQCLYCTNPGHSAEYPFCDQHMLIGMGYECPDCAGETRPEWKYCPKCGYSLESHHLL